MSKVVVSVNKKEAVIVPGATTLSFAPKDAVAVRVTLESAEVTPTTDLRKWFAHNPAKFDEFKARYIEQLDSRPEAARFADDVRNLLRDTNVTLLYAARDPRVNHVVILRDWLLERLT